MGDILDDLMHAQVEAAEIKEPPRKVGDVAYDLMRHMRDIVDGKITELGIKTGLRSLDAVLCDLRASSFYVIQGPTGGGKTILGLQVASHAASQGKTVLFCSLEMEPEELVERQLASDSGVQMNIIRSGHYLEQRIERLQVAADALQTSTLYIDSTSVTPMDIHSRARWMQIHDSLDMIVVDYIQLMEPSTKSGNRQEEMQSISRHLKLMARELKVPVIGLSQENEDGSVRESRAPEHAASAIIKIMRDDKKAELHIKKNRHGPTAMGDNCLSMNFVGHLAKFEEVE